MLTNTHTHTHTLQLVDITGTGQMSFNSFCQLFGIMSRSTLQERLKLLFILHMDQLEEGSEKIDYSKLRAPQENGMHGVNWVGGGGGGGQSPMPVCICTYAKYAHMHTYVQSCVACGVL